jgi:hypothetical protein
MVKGAGRYPCLTSQILDRGTSEAVVTEQPAPRGDQRSAGLRNLLGAQGRRF